MCRMPCGYGWPLIGQRSYNHDAQTGAAPSLLEQPFLTGRWADPWAFDLVALLSLRQKFAELA
jgi:hypothetical protein